MLCMSRTLAQRKNGEGFPKAGELIEFRAQKELTLQGPAHTEPADRTRRAAYSLREEAADTHDRAPRRTIPPTSTCWFKSPLAIPRAALLSLPICPLIQRAVSTPIEVAAAKVNKHSRIVVCVLALIWVMKSPSGTTTTMSQSRPSGSFQGVTLTSCRSLSMSKLNCRLSLIWLRSLYWLIICWLVARITPSALSQPLTRLAWPLTT